jgi:hypothetical protein
MSVREASPRIAPRDRMSGPSSIQVSDSGRATPIPIGFQPGTPSFPLTCVPGQQQDTSGRRTARRGCLNYPTC